jgi:hypothetical protein
VSGKALQTFDEERHRAGTGAIGVAMDAHYGVPHYWIWSNAVSRLLDFKSAPLSLAE